MSPRASKLVVTAALAMALPASAQAVVLHDQTSPVGSHEISSEAFDTPSSFHDSQVADDFTVPAGQSWTLTDFSVIGDNHPFNGQDPPHISNVFIYNNELTLPGTRVYSYYGDGVFGYPNDSVRLDAPSPPPLPPGTYWISLQEDGGGFMVPSWSWFTRSAQDGSPAVFQGAGGWGSNCSNWKPITTCPSAISEPDVAWKISGSADSLAVSFGKLKPLGNGTAKLAVTLPAPGTLLLRGTKVKGASAQVPAASPNTVTLKIRAIGKARKTLNRTDKVTVRAKFIYTAAGASPSTTIKKMQLKKG